MPTQITALPACTTSLPETQATQKELHIDFYNDQIFYDSGFKSFVNKIFDMISDMFHGTHTYELKSAFDGLCKSTLLLQSQRGMQSNPLTYEQLDYNPFIGIELTPEQLFDTQIDFLKQINTLKDYVDENQKDQIKLELGYNEMLNKFYICGQISTDEQEKIFDLTMMFDLKDRYYITHKLYPILDQCEILPSAQAHM